MNNLNYNICKDLKSAGFPQEGNNCLVLQDRIGEICGLSEEEHDKKCNDWDCKNCEQVDAYMPLLDELIEACGIEFTGLYQEINDKENGIYWYSTACINGRGKLVEVKARTRIEAVANLWLKLKKFNN